MSAVRTSLRSALTAGLLGAALLAVPAQANAAGEARDHCVSNLSTGGTACFGTFRDAVAHGTNGQVTDAPLSAHGGLTTGPKAAMVTMGAMDNKTTGLTFG
ncbi:hypothetical protein ACF06N_27180 [Streptomyces albidoflavus]